MRRVRLPGALLLAWLVVVIATPVRAATAVSPTVASYPMGIGSDRLLVRAGVVWADDHKAVRRVDLTAAPFWGEFDTFVGPGPVTAAGRFWSVGLGTTECAGGGFPYVVRGLDPAGGAPVEFALPRAAGCQAADNRGPQHPALVASGDALWLTVPATADWQILRIDARSGNVVTAATKGHTTAIAADRNGAWTMSPDPHAVGYPDPNSGPFAMRIVGPAGPAQLGRLRPDGSVASADLLPHTRLEYSVAVTDRTGLWVQTAARTADRPGTGRELLHVARDGTMTPPNGVHVTSAAAGDGQTWFVGTVDRTSVGADVLGRVDPRTGQVVRTLTFDQLGLPRDSSVVAVSGGRVWLATSDTVGRHLVTVG